MNNTPETDEIEKHDGLTISDSVTTCGDESSSVYINVIHARELERERDRWKDCADRLVASSGWHDQWPQAVAHYRKLKEELK
jgi:hypothetical protein